MLEREWVCRKQAIACQYGYSTSHVATVNYVIEVCLYPPLLHCCCFYQYAHPRFLQIYVYVMSMVWRTASPV